MKRALLSIFAILSLFNVCAQEAPVANIGPVKETLSSFKAIDINAPIKLKLTKIDKTETPYIVYDTKGAYTSKFTFEVQNRDGGILKIEERSDPKRESVTEVEVYFNELTDISISKADTTVDGVLDSQLLDQHIQRLALHRRCRHAGYLCLRLWQVLHCPHRQGPLSDRRHLNRRL